MEAGHRMALVRKSSCCDLCGNQTGLDGLLAPKILQPTYITSGGPSRFVQPPWSCNQALCLNTTTADLDRESFPSAQSFCWPVPVVIDATGRKSFTIPSRKLLQGQLHSHLCAAPLNRCCFFNNFFSISEWLQSLL